MKTVITLEMQDALGTILFGVETWGLGIGPDYIKQPWAVFIRPYQEMPREKKMKYRKYATKVLVALLSLMKRRK